MREKIKNEPGEIQFFASLGKSNLKTWLGIFLLIASVALFSACAPTGDDAEPTTPDVTQEPDPEPTTPPAPLELTTLEVAQKDASDAMDAAKTAADMAKDAYDAAAMAGANRATIQTGSKMYDMNLDAAKDAYDDAMEAYETAKMESEAAQAATDVVTATKAAVRAEDAQKDAEEALEMADTASKAAVEAAMSLLMYNNAYSIGDKMIDLDASNQVVTTTTGGTTKIVNTGFQEDLKQESVGMETGVAFAANTDPTEDTEYVQGRAARDIIIGKTVDSADDSARLAIITSYVGTKTVKVFAYGEVNPGIDSTADGRTGTVLGKLTLNDHNADTTDDTNNTTLRSLGKYYLAGGDGVTDLAGTLVIAANTEPVTVYSYVDPDSDGDGTADDPMTHYLVMDSQRTDGGTTTYIYREVDITAAISDDVTDGTADDEKMVTTTLPDAAEYEHINFGVWTNLNEDGTAASAIGIGFVQSVGDGMTEASDMPNHMSAEYNGNWVATVQVIDEEGDGAVNLEDGEATITADFEKLTVEAVLKDLATLSADIDIDGNTFSGTEVSDMDNGNLSSNADDFKGSTSGGFFGTRAAEIGGVFSFTSEDNNKDGAFSGAFGGQR